MEAEDYDERAVFDREATQEAQRRFKAGLKKEGHSSVEAMMAALRGEEESELLKHVCIMEREAKELHFKATNPFASPAESFEWEISAQEVEESIYVFNTVLAELQSFQERNQYGDWKEIWCFDAICTKS